MSVKESVLEFIVFPIIFVCSQELYKDLHPESAENE